MVREDGSLVHGGSGGGGERLSDSRYILKVHPTRLTARLDTRS